jgi:branched-subunit amino acid transport protein AzlD
MSTGRIFIAILISAAITFLLRALPFLCFRGNKKMPEKLVYLGDILPSAIMAVLIVYCLKDVGSDWTGVGIPKLIAVAVVALSYKWKHNTLLSILGGTLCYMILLHIGL